MSDRLSASRLRDFAGPWWRDFFISEVTASTNTDAARAVGDLNGEGYVFLTEHQTQGRGRLDREWETPPGQAITMSLVLRPERDMADWPWLSFAAALAVKTTIDQWLDEVTLKWPNDVMVSEKKIAGILSEIVGDAVIIGIGINVSQKELPTHTATSLWAERGQEFDRTVIAGTVLNVFAQLYQQWLSDPDLVREQYRKHCSTISQEVEIHAVGKVHRGVVSGVDDAGRLVFGTESFSLGDVVRVRATDVGN